MVVAFVSQLSKKDQYLWLQALNTQLPDITILPIENLSAEELNQCKIAIVANPDPDEVALLPNLIWIQSLWAGVDALAACFSHATFKLVRLVDPMLAKTMSEAVLTWVLYFHRDMHIYAEQQIKQQWLQHNYRSPNACSVGILGLGELGKKSAIRLRDNGFTVSGWSLNEKFISGVKSYSGNTGLFELAQHCQIIVCLLPLTDQTKHLLNTTFFKNLKQGSIIINFSRGGLIENKDLLIYLDIGHLAHAVLDVFDEEPLNENNPFWKHPKVTVLPHVSAPTSLVSACEIVANNIQHYQLTGDVPVSVDFNKGY